MSSQWVFVTRGDITKVEDLKGKTIGYGRLGSADYDEGATYLARFFNMQVGKDYKVIAYQGEPERIPALLNKDIDATMVSAAHAAQAVSMGMKVIARTSDKMPRVGARSGRPRLHRQEPRDREEIHPGHRQGRGCICATTRMARSRRSRSISASTTTSSPV